MGLGLTNNNVWQLFAVILVHQIITSISLGKDNSKNGFQTKISRAKLSTHFGILSVVVCTKHGVLHWAWLGLCGGLCCTLTLPHSAKTLDLGCTTDLTASKIM